jgi:pyrimidine-nucleoside phosphorylase
VNPGSFSARDVIARKRDGAELAETDIDAFIRAFVKGEVADYQMSAFLMAAFLRGLSGEETAALTRTMVASGTRLDLGAIPGIKVDKHSTGGVGDKVSIPLAPLVAACGVPVPMISGRGLGHTGGTLDKLESIPGFRTRISADEFKRILADVGCVMGGQTEDLAPADRSMYALRDVTATVESIPLIVSSILSKKIAEGAEALVLDVKFGRGAFMSQLERATELARELARVGGKLGLRTVAFLTDMDRPLGTTIGNALEVEESVELLKGGGPADLREITVTLGGAMLVLGGVAADFAEGRKRLETAIEDGSGLEKFRRLIEAHDGDSSVVDNPERLPRAPVSIAYPSPVSGYVTDMDPRKLAEAVLALGGGRHKVDDVVDPAAGIRILRQRGDRVSRGEPILTVAGRDESTIRRLFDDTIAPAIRVEAEPPPPSALIRSILTGDLEQPWDPARPPRF